MIAPHDKQSIIGRFARIHLTGTTQDLVGNVIDLDSGGRPKRVRIQFGDPARKGDVVFPSEYVFLGFCDEEED